MESGGNGKKNGRTRGSADRRQPVNTTAWLGAFLSVSFFSLSPILAVSQRLPQPWRPPSTGTPCRPSAKSSRRSFSLCGNIQQVRHAVHRYIFIGIDTLCSLLKGPCAISDANEEWRAICVYRVSVARSRALDTRHYDGMGFRGGGLWVRFFFLHFKGFSYLPTELGQGRD